MSILVQRWPRLCELLIGASLAVVPWLIEAPAALRVHDAIAAAAMLGITAWSMAQPERLVHLWNLLVAAWLSGFALLFSRSVHSPAAQNELLIGLTLALFAIIPSRTMEVPAGWRRFFAENPHLAEEERQAVAAREPVSEA